MKTQIIQLEPHDDVVSTRDKMGWSQTSRILLVWPTKGRLLERRLDLVLLQRHSFLLGAQLALVTQEAEILYNAHELGIPAFDNTKKAQSARWRVGRKRRPRSFRRKPLPDLEELRDLAHPREGKWRDKPVVRISVFIISFLAVMAVLGALLPSSQISLSPTTKIQQIKLPVTASKDYSTLNLTGELPAHTISVVVEAQGSITTTGQIAVPQFPATGYVQFTNLTDHTVRIPSGTVVSTLGANPFRFTTTQAGLVVTGPGTTANVPVKALTPGSQGNLKSNSLQAIDGSLGLELSVTNPSDTFGGTDQPAPAPAPGDRTQLYNRLFTALRKTAANELELSASSTNEAISLQTGDFPILPTLTFSHILEQTYDPPSSGQNQPAEQLHLTLRLEFNALAVSDQDLNDLARPVLEANLPAGYLALPGTIQIQHLTTPELDSSGVAHWQIQFSQTLQTLISPERVIRTVQGKPVTRALKDMVDQLPLQALPKIRVEPAWWPYLPVLPLRISITTGTE